MKIIFFGTQEFAVEILQELIDSSDFEINLVITQPDKPVGRRQEIQKPPVKILAEKYGLKVEQPGNLKTFDINQAIWDLGIVAQYGLLIPKNILEAPKYGLINVHPSLLPKYRGASPIQSAILNGEKKTGITIMKLDAGMDTGPILLQKSLKIEPEDIYPTLEQKMAEIAKELLKKAIFEYISGELKPMPQDNLKATYCQQFTREDGKIDWRKSAQEIYNQWRAFQVWPGVWGKFKIKDQDLRIKLSEVKLSEESRAGNIGSFIKIAKNRLGIICGDKKMVEVLKLQPEGRKIMTTKEFLNGYLK